MPIQLRLQKSHIADLAFIRDMPSQDFDSVLSLLEGMAPLPLRPTQLVEPLVNTLHGNEQLANSLVRQLLSLCTLMRQMSLSVDETLEGILGVIERDSGWSADDIDKWRAIETYVRRLLSVSAVTVVAKSVELSYEYANLFQHVRILTDIRPLFDEDAENIRASVVSFTLRLRYDSAEGQHATSIVMDEQDVKKMEVQCQRALRKARLAREMMQSSGIETIISGQDEHD